jgi:hypothetical protein
VKPRISTNRPNLTSTLFDPRHKNKPPTIFPHTSNLRPLMLKYTQRLRKLPVAAVQQSNVRNKTKKEDWL